MLRYIMLFVLVMLMVKTNAQSSKSFYYNKDRRVELKQSDTRLFIILKNPNDLELNNRLLNRIKMDGNFHLLVSDVTELRTDYVLLIKNANSRISKSQAVSNYMDDPAVASASFVFDNPDGTFRVPSNDIFIGARQGTSIGEIRAYLSSYKYLSLTADDYDKYLFHIQLAKGADVLQVANSLHDAGNFRYVEPSFIHTVNLLSHSDSSCNPGLNDSLFAEQWALYNNGASSYYQTGYRWTDMNVCHAWNSTTGSYGVTVAVMDDGVDMKHPDLFNGVDSTGWTTFSNQSYPYMGTYAGAPAVKDKHGTPCAGIIRAMINNTIGVAGIAPSCRLVPARFAYFHFFIQADITSDVEIKNAFDWCTYTAQADVLSMSWGSTGGSSMVADAIDRATTDGRGGKGCIVVCGAGNSNTSGLLFPASYEKTIAVGALSMCDERKSHTSCDGDNSWGSNYGTGASTGYNNLLSVVAPGKNIPAIDLRDTAGYNSGHYTLFEGTSAACPHVSAVAALILSVNSCLTWQDVKEIIERSADKINTGTYSYSYFYDNGYWNDEVGFGRLNAGNAVELSQHYYKQNKRETTTRLYESLDTIYAGDSVTTACPYGHYIVDAGADITFQAGRIIHLRPGVEIRPLSYFTATTLGTYYTPCTTGRYYFKQSPISEDQVVNDGRQHGINKLLSGVNIYPNPVNDRLNITFNLDDRSEVSFLVSNLLGQNMLQQQAREMEKGRHNETLSTSGLAPGIYLLTVKTSTGESQFRFIKE